MSNGAQFDREDEDGAREREWATRTTWSRRAVLGRATGGVVLAASGLVLPEWLVEEVEAADNHPARRILERKEHQRQKRRHRLAHRRKVNRRQRDKNAKDDTSRGIGRLGIEFRVELTGGRPVKVDFYVKPEKKEFFSTSPVWAFTDRETLAVPGHGAPTHTFSTEDPDAALWIDDRYLVLVHNPPITPPWVTLGYGGAFRNHTVEGWGGGKEVLSMEELKEGKSAPAMQVEGYRIQPTRLDDDTGIRRKVYKVTIAAPAA